MQKRVILSRQNVLPAMQAPSGPPGASPWSGAAYQTGTLDSQRPLTCMSPGYSTPNVLQTSPFLVQQASWHPQAMGQLSTDTSQISQKQAQDAFQTAKDAAAKAAAAKAAAAKAAAAKAAAAKADAAKAAAAKAAAANAAAVKAAINNETSMMAKLSAAAVKSNTVSKASSTCSTASSTCSTASSTCSTMTMQNEFTSATFQARARAEQNTKVTINTQSHATAQKVHQYVAPATDSVTSALQGDLSVPKTRLQSQTDCFRVQVPATKAQAHCTKASAESSFSSAATTTKQKGWLTLPIGKLSSGASTRLVSDNHEDEPSGLLKFLARYGVDWNCAKEVAGQIEFSHDDRNARLPMFTQQMFDDHPHFQVWSQCLSL